MRTAIEQAGAKHGVLVLSSWNEPRIAAEAATSGDIVIVELRDEPATAAALPESVLHFVVRTNESVILDDAMAKPPSEEDPYIRGRRAHSILCVPLINQAKPTGLLYLENNLARRSFAPGRTAVLKLLASQATIALENTPLYRDLAEREAKIQRLVDANIIGIFIGSIPEEVDEPIVEANDAFLPAGRIGARPQSSTVRLDDRTTDRQPQSQAVRFGRVEGVVVISSSLKPSLIPLMASVALRIKLRTTCCNSTRSP